MKMRSQSRFPLWLGFGLFSFLLRLPLLSDSFWLDEAAQALESTRPWWQQFDLAADFQPPLFHLWVFLLQHISHSEAWLRLASVLPGVASIMLFTALAQRWFSRKTAVWVGLLLSTSSLMVFFSQELRPYMFAVGWCSLAAFAFFELLFSERENERKQSSFFLLVFTLANAAAILSSYVALFLLPGWLITTFLLRREKTILMLKSLCVSGLFFGSWFLGLQQQLAVGSDLRQILPGWDQVVSLPQAKALLLTLGKFVTGRLPLDFTPLHLAIVGIPFTSLIGAIGFSLWRNRSPVLRAATLLFGLPIVITWIFSFWIPVLEPKRVLYVLPWIFLLVAVISTRWRWSWILGSVWLGIQVYGLLSYWQNPALQREPWREAVRMVENQYQPENSAVIFGFDAAFAPWRWYQTENFPVFNTGLDPLDGLEEAHVALAGGERYENVVLFDYLRDLTDPEREIERVLAQKGFREIAVWDYSNIGFVRLFYREQLFAQR